MLVGNILHFIYLGWSQYIWYIRRPWKPSILFWGFHHFSQQKMVALSEKDITKRAFRLLANHFPWCFMKCMYVCKYIYICILCIYIYKYIYYPLVLPMISPSGIFQYPRTGSREHLQGDTPLGIRNHGFPVDYTKPLIVDHIPIFLVISSL